MECSICLNDFSDPRILACGHTFCLRCLRSLLNGRDTLTCPKCRNVQIVTDVMKIPKNFAILEMLDEIRGNNSRKSSLDTFASNLASAPPLAAGDLDGTANSQQLDFHSALGTSPVAGVTWDVWNWFKAVDQDDSGAISFQELQLALLNFNMSSFNDDTCKLLISMFDSDRNGTIDIHEFAELLDYVMKWKAHFDHYDTDGSGTIDARELQSIFQELGYQISPQNAAQCVAFFNRDRKTSLRQSHNHHNHPLPDQREPTTLSFDNYLRCCVALYKTRDALRQPGAVRNVSNEQFMHMVMENLLFVNR